MSEIEEGATEYVTFEQLMHKLMEEEKTGKMPIALAPVQEQREPVPGEELAKHRVRISFEFDVRVNTAPILNSHDDQDMKVYDLALLAQFLKTPQLIDMLVDCAATQLGLNGPETFIERFLPQIDTNSHALFREAILGLSGDHGEYWRDIRDAPKPSTWETLLSICSEDVYSCFDATFVQSACELIGDTMSNTITIDEHFFEHLLNCMCNQKYLPTLGAVDLASEQEKQRQQVIDKAYQEARDLWIQNAGETHE